MPLPPTSAIKSDKRGPLKVTALSYHGVRVVTVDYRMPPDYPYPAGLDDCLVFYRALLRDYAPHQIIVGGGSAGARPPA